MLSNKKWFTWLMLFIAPPYGIYLLFKNREKYATFVPYLVGGIFSIPFIVMLFMEDGVLAFISYLILLLFAASIVALIKGEVSSLYLRNRKVAGIVLGLSFVGIIAVGTLLPEVEETTEGTTTEVQDETDNAISDEEKEEKEKEAKPEEKERESASDEEKETESEEEELADTNNEKEKNEPKEDASTEKSNGNLRVHFVNVGQGATQVIVTPSGKVMLIDAGDNDDEDDIVAYLKELGISRIDYVIGTHPDADHVGGLDAAIDAFTIGEIYMPKISANTITFEDVLQAIKNKGLKVKTGTEGVTLNLGDGIKTEFLAPIGSSSDRNEMSIVVKLTYGETSFLFTGDADGQSEREMIAAHGSKLNADVLSVGHHGSNTSTTQDFLNYVTPDYAVIQVGKNSYGHPAEEVLKRLTNAGAEIYRNDKQGTIVFTTNGQKVDINTNAWTYQAPTSPPQNNSKPKQENETTDKPKENTSKPGSLSVTSSISNPNPEQNSSVTVTVSVKDQNGNPVSGAQVDLNLHYKSKDTPYSATTGSNGKATLTFQIGRASKGFEVVGDITASVNGVTGSTTTSFTPK